MDFSADQEPEERSRKRSAFCVFKRSKNSPYSIYSQYVVYYYILYLNHIV